MELVSAGTPSSSTAAYVSWDEVNVSTDKGRREVHYYLKRRDGISDLAVIGKEKSLRHMSYHFAIKNRSLFFSNTPFYKLKTRREVVYWLESVVSDSSSREPYSSVGGFCDEKNVNLDFGAVKAFQSRKLGQCTKEFLWLGSSWTCRKKRKHYQSFRRNGVIISIHNFVYVLAEEHKRLIAYLEDMYEDSRGSKMVVVRWFHKIDEVDGLATVLCPDHFKKFLKEASHTQLDPFVCGKQFKNDDVKPFDITQVEGYWNQDILRYMYGHLTSNDCVSRQQRADDQKADADDGVGIRPRKRCRQSNDDVSFNYSDIRESMDALCADVHDFVNSKNGTESFSFSARNSAILSTDEAKQNSSLHLKVGSKVEVLAQDSGIRGCWFRALIIKKHKDKVKVQYQDIQDAADEAKKLEEWILASRVAVPDPVGIRISGRPTIRPSPQCPKGSASCIVVGSVVDVWWHDGWWEGIVVKNDSEDKLHVYFPGEKRESIFNPGDIRNSQEWLGNRWIDIKQRHDVVRSIVLGRKQDAVKSNDCNLAKTTICDSGHCGKDATACDDCPVEPGNDGAKDVGVVPDLSKDDLLSQLKWKSFRKRKRGTVSSVKRLNCGRNFIKRSAELAGSASCERFLIPASLKVENDNCKYMGDPLFSSSAVPPLTNLVMTRRISASCNLYIISASVPFVGTEARVGWRPEVLFSLLGLSCQSSDCSNFVSNCSRVSPRDALSFFTLQTEASQKMGSFEIEPWYLLLLLYEELFSVYITHKAAMVLPGQPKKEVSRIELDKPKRLLLPGTCLASVESLSMPLVCILFLSVTLHEVVLSADIRCEECQRRIADIMSRMNDTDSVLVNVLEKKVTLTCRYPGIVNLPSRQVPIIYRTPVSTVAMIKRIFRSSRNEVLKKAVSDMTFLPYHFSCLSGNLKSKLCCMVLRLNIDCHGCYRKLRRILLNIKEIETHAIEKQECRVSLCGRFRPSDIAIKIRKKMNRRVEILEIQEVSDEQNDPNPIITTQ
ncbi:hypothetical protein COLO4_07905 [Corchorus olitorius]|uniref:Agenet domain-containing protein n=1 Tax=Corchorus olitorius TaxID=93759 RepID=A0A1R3KI52_9ROSI|nr:hypothetical protein COLO4_07905 [Corchorus olitorius]